MVGIFLDCTFTFPHNTFCVIQFYCNLGLTFNNMLEALSVRHNLIISLKILKRILKKDAHDLRWPL